MTASVRRSGESPSGVGLPRPLLIDLVVSEWVKLRTLRSSYWTLLAAIISMVGFGGLLDEAYVRHLTPVPQTVLHVAGFSESGFFLAELAIGVLGVLMLSGEYATGSIHSTLAATPQRLGVLAAKAAVFTIVSFVVGLFASFGAFFLGQAIFAGKGISVTLGDPGVLRSVIGAALYLAVFGLLSLGIGAVVRRTAGAIAILVAVMIFLQVAVGGLPQTWQSTVTPYLPSVAGQMIIGPTKFTPPGPLLSPWTGFAVFCGYATALLVVGGISLHRRDA
ncbi:MAG TPA: ABC transporter permease subunit [Acidimicrobiales bacterium]|nr:ABC transporter permease subunit [Acidimicrobiales bacterium]